MPLFFYSPFRKHFQVAPGGGGELPAPHACCGRAAAEWHLAASQPWAPTEGRMEKLREASLHLRQKGHLPVILLETSEPCLFFSPAWLHFHSSQNHSTSVPSKLPVVVQDAHAILLTSQGTYIPVPPPQPSSISATSHTYTNTHIRSKDHPIIVPKNLKPARD